MYICMYVCMYIYIYIYIHVYVLGSFPIGLTFLIAFLPNDLQNYK